MTGPEMDDEPGPGERRCNICGVPIRDSDTDGLCEQHFEMQQPALSACVEIQRLISESWDEGISDYTLQSIIDALSDAGFNPRPDGLRRTPAERMQAAMDQLAAREAVGRG